MSHIPGAGKHGADQTEEAASRLIRRLSEDIADLMGEGDMGGTIGDANAIRRDVVDRVDREAGDFDHPQDAERFRRAAQRMWNEGHPDMPILEWSREDGPKSNPNLLGYAYKADGPKGVLYERRAASVGNKRISRRLAVIDKVTGNDVTDDIRHLYGLVTSSQEDLASLRQFPRLRRRGEVMREICEPKFEEWMRTTLSEQDWKKVETSIDFRRTLWYLFDQDTHLVTSTEKQLNREQVVPTTGEQRMIDTEKDRHDTLRGELQELCDKCGVSSRDMLHIAYQRSETDS